MSARNLKRFSLPSAILVGCLLLVGCGTNFNEVAFQTVSATGRTIYDLFLTEFLNALLGSIEQGDPPADNANDNTNDNGNGGDGGGNENDNGGVEPPAGDAAAGEAFYVASGCAACHGDDGRSGFAPPLAGVSVEDMQAKIDGTDSHAGGTVDGVTPQDAADLVAWQLSLDNSGGDGGGADAAAGEAFFAANGCAACHGSDGSSGFAPSLAAATADDVLAKLNGTESHGGGSFAGVTAEDAANVVAWLASL